MNDSVKKPAQAGTASAPPSDDVMRSSLKKSPAGRQSRREKSSDAPAKSQPSQQKPAAGIDVDAHATDGTHAKPKSRRGKRRSRSHSGASSEPAKNARQKRDLSGKIMLLNATQKNDVRIAILKDGILDDLFMDRPRATPSSGDIYKGRVTNVEPSLQAAFVDIGWEKNGFLHASDVIPPDGGYADILKNGKRRSGSDRGRKPQIEQMLSKGQEVLVQVTRESVALKGPGLTTYVSIPGRYLVMMPAVPRLGVSRKIEDPEIRRDLRKKMQRLNPPRDLGVIVRTAGQGCEIEDLERDLDYLTRLWESVRDKTRSQKAPSLVYRDSDLFTRVIRDHFTQDITQLWCDDESATDHVRDFLNTVMPDAVKIVNDYREKPPIFHYFGVQEQIEALYKRKVPLTGGGSIVIEQTEALVAIDVNSGGYRKRNTMDDTIFDTNRKAVPEIARQIRLRDMGGLVMIDFIDMTRLEHRRKIEEELKEALSHDKARINLLPISGLGVVEMTRQRTHQSVKKMLFSMCPCCEGTGMIKSPQTLLFDVLRETRNILAGEDTVNAVRIALETDSALHVANSGRRDLADLERMFNAEIEIVGSKEILPGHYQIAGRKDDGNWVVYKASEVEHVVRSG